MFPPVRAVITIGFSWTTAPIQTYFGVEVLARSVGVHAETGGATGVPHETVMLIVYSLVGNTFVIAIENGPTVLGRVEVPTFVRSGG
jgi:hypothetical protein